MTERLEPFDDRVFVMQDEAVGKSRGGVLLADAHKEQQLTGTVLAVGPGAWLSPQPTEAMLYEAFNAGASTRDIDVLPTADEGWDGTVRHLFSKWLGTRTAARRLTMRVKVGDRVRFTRYAGYDIPAMPGWDADRAYMVIRESDLMAIIEDEPAAA